jgi:hypothetical protein
MSMMGTLEACMRTLVFVVFLVWLTLAAGASLVGPPPVR